MYCNATLLISFNALNSRLRHAAAFAQYCQQMVNALLRHERACACSVMLSPEGRMFGLDWADALLIGAAAAVAVIRSLACS